MTIGAGHAGQILFYSQVYSNFPSDKWSKVRHMYFSQARNSRVVVRVTVERIAKNAPVARILTHSRTAVNVAVFIHYVAINHVRLNLVQDTRDKAVRLARIAKCVAYCTRPDARPFRRCM